VDAVPLFFAYGSCMNETSLARDVAGFRFLTPAILTGYRLGFTRYASRRATGVADIVRQSGGRVEGKVYYVPDFVGLDRREGHPIFYRRKRIRVFLVRERRWESVWAYEVVRKQREYVPSRRYAMLIWEGAAVLSQGYREQLRKKLFPNGM